MWMRALRSLLRQTSAPSCDCPKADPNDFSPFTYSRHSHCGAFQRCGLENRLYGAAVDLSAWPLKRYQDLLALSFIESQVPAGSRLLEVGGGASRLIHFLKHRYECWNADKMQGLGSGPRSVKEKGFRLVRSYIGDFSQELPADSFDFVFSISALEHTPQTDPGLFERIRVDLDRVLKPGGYSLHLFDVVLCPDRIRMNKLLPHLFVNQKTRNPFIPYETLRCDEDLFTLSESVYDNSWLPITRIPFAEFGRPFSYNILWRKPDAGSNGQQASPLGAVRRAAEPPGAGEATCGR